MKSKKCFNHLLCNASILPTLGNPFYYAQWMLLIFLVGFASWSCQAQTVVKVDGGEIRGVNRNGLNIFKGIPYAAPPVGEFRWRAPQPVKPWSGVRAATEYGNDAPQATMSSPKQDEDCLYLNVWAPATAQAGGNYPVMVWIHGGGFINGSGRLEGEALAKQGVVLVSFNYRLGRFGSFAHPALLETLPSNEPPANFWLQDQIAALTWVQRNIGAFGGDPSKVTIFGVSAGGTSVNMLMASPLAQGLFQRAIAESGVGGFGPYRRLKEEYRGRKSLVELGESFAQANISNNNNTATALRALPWKTVAKIGTAVHDREGFEGVVDGVSLLDDVEVTFKTGKQNKVPFLAGANSFEGNLSLVIPWTTEPPRSTIEKYMNQITPLYQWGPNNPAIWNDLYGDVYFRVSTLNLVQAMERIRVPAWTYYFDYVRGRGPNSRGAGHGSEVPYVMGTVLLPSNEDKEIINAMQGHWVQFAKTGNPNGTGLPQWTAYTAQNPGTMVYGQNTIGVVNNLDKAKFDILFKCVNEAFSSDGGETEPEVPQAGAEELLQMRVKALFEATRIGDIEQCISLSDPDEVQRLGRPVVEKFFKDIHNLMKVSKIDSEDHRINSTNIVSNGTTATVKTQIRLGSNWQTPGTEYWRKINNTWFYQRTTK